MLALAPEFVMRYIVAHEVSHLKHQDHSAYFWALVEYLEAHGVGTRQLFAGNLLRQPMMVDNDIPLRIGSSPVLKSCDLTEKEYALLPQTDFIMNHTFWVGTFPALGEAEMEKIAQTIRHFVHENQR